MANAGDERADREPHRLQAPGEPQDIANAIAFLCSDLAVLRHRHRAQRLRRRRAVRLLVGRQDRRYYDPGRGCLLLGSSPAAVPRRALASGPALALGASSCCSRSRSASSSPALPSRLASGTRIAGDRRRRHEPGRSAAAARPALGSGSPRVPVTFVAGRPLPVTPTAARRRRSTGPPPSPAAQRRGRRLRLRPRLPPARARSSSRRTSRRRCAPTTPALDYELGLIGEGDRRAASRGAARPPRSAHHDRSGRDRPCARPWPRRDAARPCARVVRACAGRAAGRASTRRA